MPNNILPLLPSNHQDQQRILRTYQVDENIDGDGGADTDADAPTRHQSSDLGGGGGGMTHRDIGG